MDRVLVKKIAIIQRCLERIREEYIGHKALLDSDYKTQDSIVLNLQRCCEAAIDLAIRLAQTKQLGVPEVKRDAFALLAKGSIIPSSLSDNLQAMVGFCNRAVHDYQQIDMGKLRIVLDNHLVDFESLIRCVLPLVGAPPEFHTSGEG